MKFYKFGIALALTTLMSSVFAQGVPHERVIQDFTRTNRLTGTPLAPAGVIPNQESPTGTMCGAYQWWLISSCQGHNPVVSCPSGYHFGIAVSSG
ncbi:hypothetical protein, partial [Limnohabitans sp.]|uniref:hypothetical protein n=1 Tax=Limnohabitans sp. TaxID=1907725 RepID=UPI00286F23B6